MKVNHKISQGIYVLTTNGSGCIVDAVSQVSASKEPLISVAVSKNNYTNEILAQNNYFVLSVLAKKVDPKIIETFGFHTSRTYNKFDKCELIEVEGIKAIKDSIGYMYCEIVDKIDTETHTLFIGRIKKQEVLKDSEEMTYAYYREHKDELLKVTTDQGKTAWVCTLCGYIYYGEELPDDYKCPKCGAPKKLFKKMNNNK